MDNFTLVRPEHLNHHGYLFGGMMLKWVDEIAWMAATRDFPGCTLITAGMDQIRFSRAVQNGSILRFHCSFHRQGNTSVTYAVRTFADAPGAPGEIEAFASQVTFVRLDAQGRPTPLPQRRDAAPR